MIGGLTLAGSNFVYRGGSTFGVRIDDPDPFPNDEMVVRMGGSAHLSDIAILTDLRRFLPPLDILSGYIFRAPVVFHGLGFRMDCLFKESILAISDVFLLCIGPGRAISGLTGEDPPRSVDSIWNPRPSRHPHGWEARSLARKHVGHF